MRLKIEKVFRDKETGELYKVGEIKEFSDDRAEELLGHPMKLVSKAQDEEKPKKAAKKAAPKKK